MALKQFDAARRAFQQVIELDPMFAGARMRMGDIALGLGKPNGAVRLYSSEEEIHPHYALYEQLGRLYAEAGVADSARMA